MEKGAENNEQTTKPKINSKSSLALEKLKRRATTIRSFSSSILSDSLNGSVLNEPPSENLKPHSPLFNIRRSNSARNRLSMPLGKLLESGKLDISSSELKAPIIRLNEEESKSQDAEVGDMSNALGAISISEAGAEQKVSINSLYLQLDNKVKKVSYNGPLTIAGLKMLFVEKYQYNPGPYEFPDLYIKDPIIDVYYELEDLSEVREGSVLQLNVSVSSNDLKKNMDSNFSTMVMEIRDLRRLMTQTNEVSKKQNNRLSVALPTTSRFSDLAKLAVNKSKDGEGAATTNKPKVDLGHLKSQVASLRQELSIARQLSTDFQKESDESLSNILDLTASFNEQLNSDNDAMHRLLVSGKDRMEANALELANLLEDVQKNIEEFRQDLVQRRCQPSELKMRHTSKALEKINQLLLTESEFLSEIKPSWKKTWEVMLQDIVKEQQALKEHEAIVEDMRADHEHLNETFMQLKKFTELKRKSQVQQRSFDVEPVDEELTRQALLQEISCVETNSERRLRAFEEARQSREWELRNQVNPFEEELSDFVGSAKLRKTGGTEELDRKRRQQDEDNLKAMLAPRPKPPSKAAR